MVAPNKHTVLLIEDQTAIRQMLAAMIAVMPEMSVVGQAADVATALALTETLQPDLVVLDWMLVGEPGAAYLRALQGRAKRPKVLVFSANTTGAAIREAFSLSAAGFVEKTANFDEFTAALRATVEGRAYLGPAVAAVMCQLARAPGQAAGPLTPRELEILRMVAAGHTSKAIAAQLKLSIRTVHSHRASIIRKTGIHSVAELTLYACQQGLVSQSAP